MKIRKEIRAERVMGAGFLGLILIGALLLMLPISSADGTWTSLLDACFTSTTSVCVTGLVTVTTATHWSLFGQIVIMCLIQLGGFGIITLTAGFLVLLRRQISLRNRKLIADCYNLDKLSGIVKFARNIVICTLVAEAVGAVMYATVFVPQFGWGKGLFASVFNAVSAFCNAGMDVVSETSLAPYAGNGIIMITTMLLIICSGIGFTVWMDIGRGLQNCRKRRSLKGFWTDMEVHSRLAILVTVLLIFGGAVLIYIFERSNAGTLGNMPEGEKWLNAFFQSVTTRTAGFEAVPQKALTTPSALLSGVLMFIGGSPMGTAGGMKTTTIAIMVLTTAAYLKGYDKPRVFKRSLRMEEVRTAIVVLTLGFAVLVTGTILVTALSGVSLLDGFYEVVSALGTVGLTRAGTANLTDAAKWVIIVIMYVGRLGPISLFMSMSRRNVKGKTDLPEKRILIG